MGDLLHLIQRSLSQAKEALGYDDSEKGIRKRFRYNRMNSEFRVRLRNFKAPRGLSSVRFSRRVASKPGHGITVQNLLNRLSNGQRLSDGQPAVEQYSSL